MSSLKEISIREYISKIDFKSDDWKLSQIKEDIICVFDNNVSEINCNLLISINDDILNFLQTIYISFLTILDVCGFIIYILSYELFNINNISIIGL